MGDKMVSIRCGSGGAETLPFCVILCTKCKGAKTLPFCVIFHFA